MRTISVRLDPTAEAQLQALCARTGMSQTEVVKAGIARLAQTAETPAEMAERLGLIGSFDSGQGDLGSEHSRHIREKLCARQAS
jgi:hypothetical protein